MNYEAIARVNIKVPPVWHQGQVDEAQRLFQSSLHLNLILLDPRGSPSTQPYVYMRQNILTVQWNKGEEKDGGEELTWGEGEGILPNLD